MSTQALIERMAELQVREQEQKLKKAEYEAELARVQLEHAKVCIDHHRQTLALPPIGSASGGSLS